MVVQFSMPDSTKHLTVQNRQQESEYFIYDFLKHFNNIIIFSFDKEENDIYDNQIIVCIIWGKAFNMKTVIGYLKPLNILKRW